jgi:DNA-binding response OmpR family regulator
MDHQALLPNPERTIPGRRKPEIVSDSCLYLERKTFYAAVKGMQLKLTMTEFQLLLCLAANINRIVTLEDLWAFAWKPGKAFNRKSVHVFMSRVRRKLDQHGLKINSMVGVGYILSHGRCCSPDK